MVNLSLINVTNIYSVLKTKHAKAVSLKAAMRVINYENGEKKIVK